MSILPPEALEEFKQLYQKEYGILLDNKVARYKAEKLLVLINAVYKPVRQVDSKYLYGYGKRKDSK